MRKKDAKRLQTQADSATVADLKRAVEELVSGRKKSEELQGIISEAKALAYEWKDSKNQRPLFREIAHNTNFLLAALVVELSRDHKLVEHLRRYVPSDLDELIKRSWIAFILKAASYLPEPGGKQKYEYRRGKWNRSFFNSIEYQFGGGLEAKLRKRPSALFRPDDSSYKPVLSSMQTCLDNIFAAESIDMLRLEELFNMDRHRLSAILQGVKKRRYDWRDVGTIMHSLLRKDPRKKRKKLEPGRPPQMPWLNDADLRTRVRSGIKARLTSIPVEKKIATAFLAIVDPPHSGKK